MEKNLVQGSKKIVYRIYGSGPAVLMIHGFGEVGSVWKKQVDALQNKYQFIIPDLPGSGDSELIADISIEGMAETIKLILDQEKKDSIILIGHSMGGYIALAFAEKYPSCLKGLGLFHSTAYPDSEEKKATRRKGIGFIREHGAFEFLKTTSPNLFSPLFKTDNQPVVGNFIQSLNNFSADSLVSYYEAMIRRPDRRIVLENTAIPILFILGKYDTAIPLEDTLKLCSLPEKSYIHILRKSGHMGMMEEADHSNRILEIFFEEV